MLSDRTNELIPLTMRQHIDVDGPGSLIVDADQDSSFDPSHWVIVQLTDLEHDSDTTHLTYDEAGLLHDRLGLILGREHKILKDVLAEVIASNDKHGSQLERALGFGPDTKPLAVAARDRNEAPGHRDPADVLETIFKNDVDARSRTKGDGTLSWWHILREEVFEAAAEDDPTKLRAELVQVAAVAFKAIQALEYQQALCRGCQGHPYAADGEDPCPGYTCPDCNGSGLYEGSITEHYKNGGSL